jgi:hypothetical protein
MVIIACPAANGVFRFGLAGLLISGTHLVFVGATGVRTYSGTDVIDSDALFPGLTLIAQELFALPDLGQ